MLSVDYVLVKSFCQLQKTPLQIKKNHLHAKHSTTELEEREPNDTCTPPQAKQQKLDFSSRSPPGKTISSTELNRLVAAFIVEEMQPLSTVEAPTFRNIISKISVTGKRQGAVLPDRKAFWKRHIWKWRQN